MSEQYDEASGDLLMNWRRGLFRAWLLISPLWIAGVCVLAVPSVRSSLEGLHTYVPAMRKDKGFPADGSLSEEQWKLPYYEIFLPAKDPVTFDIPGYEVRSAIEKEYVAKGLGSVVQFPDGGRLFLSRYLMKEDEEFIARSFWGQRWSRWWAAAWGWVLGGFLPPAVLLVLGYSLLWVGRGFRR